MPLRTDKGVIALDLQFLLESKKMLLQWKMSDLAGLTKETFLACIHTLETMVELTAYLQKNHGFSYVLPGKFMSTFMESRFD